MVRTHRLFSILLFTLLSASACFAAETPAPTATTPAAAVAGTQAAPAYSDPDLIEYAVDEVLHHFGVESSGNTLTHWLIFAGLFLGSWVLRKFVCTAIFSVLKKLASKTETTLDDKLFPVLESPANSLIFVVGSLMAFKVLKLSPTFDAGLFYAFKLAFPTVIFWGLINALSAVVDHLGEIATQKGLGIAAFLPLIKKTLIGLFIIIATLTIIQSFGYDVKTFLAGLGIGGLAFALAAQDTLANLFGSFVVAIDQPFRVGEVVQIGAHAGKVEDIGMRSTKIRTAARTLIAIPNRSVANEAVTNLTRMPQRRIDTTIGLSYNTTPEQMEAVLGDIRAILKDDPEVHQDSVLVHFTNYNASSLEIQIVYFTSDPDFNKHYVVRERINLAIMKTVSARGLAFAFPTRTIQLEASTARALSTRT